MKYLISGVLVGALAAGLAAAPAEASADDGGFAGSTSLRLTVSYPANTLSGTRTVVLSCDPAGGSHPQAARACADLRAHHGAVDHDPAEGICPMIYRPVIARAVGRWHDRAVSFRREYGNDCLMHARTGSVFAF
ncbi:SSI family serine proteinase inhibitor [Actinomadura gamaensis]|uniref:SSI family serine proteinase inhibitor n=1 Tax=Actinomadura gamaensis TaxID=1763541 RepID=A0ABV9U5L6_9ACTN